MLESKTLQLGRTTCKLHATALACRMLSAFALGSSLAYLQAHLLRLRKSLAERQLETSRAPLRCVVLVSTGFGYRHQSGSSSRPGMEQHAIKSRPRGCPERGAAPVPWSHLLCRRSVAGLTQQPLREHQRHICPDARQRFYQEIKYWPLAGTLKPGKRTRPTARGS